MTKAREQSLDRPSVRAHGFVRGRVQGVWFRESTRQRAVELELGGWVRNLPDGRVEAEFVGPREAVNLARAFIQQGPEHARVDGIEGFELEELPEARASEASGFHIR